MASRLSARHRALVLAGATTALVTATLGTAVASPGHGRGHGSDHGHPAHPGLALFTDSVPGSRSIPALGTLDGPNGSTVRISGGGYGSSLAPVPGRHDWFYGLTDRGPNADDDGPADVKTFTDPTFHPQIGLFHLVHGNAVLHRTIVLRSPDGTPYNGLPNPVTAVPGIYTEVYSHTFPVATTDMPVTLSGAGGSIDMGAIQANNIAPTLGAVSACDAATTARSSSALPSVTSTKTGISQPASLASAVATCAITLTTSAWSATAE